MSGGAWVGGLTRLGNWWRISRSVCSSRSLHFLAMSGSIEDCRMERPRWAASVGARKDNDGCQPVAHIRRSEEMSSPSSSCMEWSIKVTIS